MKKPAPYRNTATNIVKRILRHENIVLALVLAALIGTMSAVSDGLTSRIANMTNILIQSSIRGVASVGQTFVIITAGIDVSVGGVALMCAMLGTSYMTLNPIQNIMGSAATPISPVIMVPIMVVVGAAWGLLNGTLVSRAAIPALIVTLAMWQISTGVAFQVGRGLAIMKLPEELSFFGSGTVFGVPVPIIIVVVVFAVAYFILNYTTFGRSVYAVGGNSVSAWLSGIGVKNIQQAVYVISGLLAGLAAVVQTGRTMSASMQSLSGLELDSIASVAVGGVSIFGGRGDIIGVIIGVLIIGVINNGMSVMGANPAVQGIVKGVIILAAVGVDFLRRR